MSEELIKRLREWRSKMPSSWYGNDMLDEAIAALSRPAPAVQVPEGWRDMVKRMERELQACQAVIHLAGGFDPAYVRDAQAVLKDARAMLAAAPAPATAATEAVAQGGGCNHRFMYFGDQKFRRCADCCEVEHTVVKPMHRIDCDCADCKGDPDEAREANY